MRKTIALVILMLPIAELMGRLKGWKWSGVDFTPYAGR